MVLALLCNATLTFSKRVHLCQGGTYISSSVSLLRYTPVQRLHLLCVAGYFGPIRIFSG